MTAIRKPALLKPQMQSIELGESFLRDPAQWLEANAREIGTKYLFATSIDGITWGLMDDERLRLSSEVDATLSPALDAKKMLECRLFSPQAELFLYRVDGQWKGRVVTDLAAESECALDEEYLLWGEESMDQDTAAPFRLFVEGEQGFRQLLPIPDGAAPAGARKAKLKVRHYLKGVDQSPQEALSKESKGQLHIWFSRLVDLETY